MTFTKWGRFVIVRASLLMCFDSQDDGLFQVGRKGAPIRQLATFANQEFEIDIKVLYFLFQN